MSPLGAGTQEGLLAAIDPRRTASVYVHVPYCVERCRYCDFNVTRRTHIPRDEYTRAVLAEGAARSAALTGRRLESVYFGGGTPSLWGAEGVGAVLAACRQWGSEVSAELEVTLEANPLEAATFASYAAVGVNRLSLGVQTLSDECLRGLNRGHDARQALTAIEAALAAGFRSVSVDLIFGLPGQTLEAFEGDVTRVLALGVPHLSVYQLTLEPRTGLGAQAARGELRLPAEDTTDAQWERLHTLVKGFGLVSYEISNHGVPGHWSRHNTGYWLGQPYLGLGAGAHSFSRLDGAAGVGAERRENLRPHRDYLAAALAGRDPVGTAERLGPHSHAFERLFTGLRFAAGVDLRGMSEELGVSLARYDAVILELAEAGLMEHRNVAGAAQPEDPGGAGSSTAGRARLCLTERGRSLSDSVFGRLASAM